MLGIERGSFCQHIVHLSHSGSPGNKRINKRAIAKILIPVGLGFHLARLTFEYTFTYLSWVLFTIVKEAPFENGCNQGNMLYNAWVVMCQISKFHMQLYALPFLVPAIVFAAVFMPLLITHSPHRLSLQCINRSFIMLCSIDALI